MAVIDLFDRGWRLNPTGVAYEFEGTNITFEAAYRESCRIANALLKSDFKRGAKAAVLSLNHPTAWVCVLGIWRAGMTWVPLNPKNTARDNEELLRSFDCELLFVQRNLNAPWIADSTLLPLLRRHITIDGEQMDRDSLTSFLHGIEDTRPVIRYELDEVAALMPTGGTTGGVPKGVMNTHRCFQTFAANFCMNNSYAPGEEVVNLAAAPMTHTSGILALPCTSRGGRVVILPTLTMERVLDAIELAKVTELFLPPTVIYGLLAHPGAPTRDYSSLRYFFYGAAPMSIGKLKEALRMFGPVMTGIYGQTEALGSISQLSPQQHFGPDGEFASDARLASAGLPPPLTAVAILDPQGNEVPSGETGEICARGDIVMKGYYKAPDKTAETVVDGWLHTGDLGSIDAEGYLSITGRAKEMIISGGFNIYPGLIEQVLWQHAAVADCAVIGVPDDKWGEAVKAVVELKPGASAEPEELIRWCRSMLNGVNTPKSVDIVASLPRSAVGKVLKRNIREPYWEGHERRI